MRLRSWLLAAQLPHCRRGDDGSAARPSGACFPSGNSNAGLSEARLGGGGSCGSSVIFKPTSQQQAKSQNLASHKPGSHPHHHLGSYFGPWSEFCRGGNSDHVV